MFNVTLSHDCNIKHTCCLLIILLLSLSSRVYYKKRERECPTVYCCVQIPFKLPSTEVKLHNLTHKLTINIWHNNHVLVLVVVYHSEQ